MFISKINSVNFGNSAYSKVNKNPEAYYDLTANEKLDVIYNMLTLVRLNQENNAEVVSTNQATIYNTNKAAFDFLSHPSYNKNAKHNLIADVFERNSVGILPSMPVFRD